MYIVLIRTVLLFVVIIAVMRLMGKRQIGQLQPAELVVTILLSEVAATPMQDTDMPLLYSFVSLMLLTGFELLLSFLALKSTKMRTLLQGNSVMIIRNGEIQYEQIRKLRYTIDDILESLRQKDVFDISEVEFAVAETNGNLSVFLKPPFRTFTTGDAKCIPADNGVPSAVVVDGELLQSGLQASGMNEKKIDEILKRKKTDCRDVLLMTVDGAGNCRIYGKDGKLR